MSQIENDPPAMIEESLLAILEQGQKTLEQDASASKLWTDGESVNTSGLIPLGDAILGIGQFLEALEDDRRPEVLEIYRGHSRLLRTTASAFEDACGLHEDAPRFSARPYLTAQHWETGTSQDPQVTAAVAYAGSCACSMAEHQELWGIEQKTCRRLASFATDLLLEHQHPAGGWTWSCDPNLDKDDKWLKPELFPTWLACQALRKAVSQKWLARHKGIEAINDAVGWVLSSLQDNIVRRKRAAWREFGTEGRGRNLDNVAALSILFENAIPEQLIGHADPIIRALKNVFRLCLTDVPTEPDYHLFRHGKLIGMVPWEDPSLLYWTNALFTDVWAWIKAHAGSPDHSTDQLDDPGFTNGSGPAGQRELIWSVKDLVTSTYARSAYRQAHGQLKAERDRDSKLWPKQSPRFYVSWAAITALAKFRQIPELFSLRAISDDLFVAVFRAFSSSLIAGEFADATVRTLETANPGLFRSFAFAAGGKRGPGTVDTEATSDGFRKRL